MTDVISLHSPADEAIYSEPSRKLEQALPHDLQAEQAVLGGLMLDGELAFDQVASVIRGTDFFREEHAVIFAALERLSEAQMPYDPITLCDDLSSRNELHKAGGADYISNLAADTPSAANVAAYARIVRERATLRQLISAANEMISRSHNTEGAQSGDVLSEAEQRLIDISEDRPTDDRVADIDTLLQGALKRIEELYESDSDITGVSTGYDDLDGMTSGWQQSDLIIIAARPSMGKTAFALNMVEHALLSNDAPVIVFSLEMPAEALMLRLLASVGRIKLKNVRDGNLSADDWDRLSKAATRLKGRKLFIDDTPGLTPTEVRARTRRISREHGLPALIMLDYIQLMRTAGSSGEGRAQEISEISRSLKQVAREFSCPMLALSQLNRGVEQRPNKRPMNSDLRESGAIEQDADVILFIYRDDYYNEDSNEKGIAEIIIGKQRNGETGTCRLQFQGEYTRFNNLAKDYFADDAPPH